jgi:Ca2+-transporting ATPase
VNAAEQITAMNMAEAREAAGSVGLTSAEARNRLGTFGPNVLVPARAFGRLREALHTLADPMALMLAAAGIVYLMLGERTEGFILLGALGPVLAVDVALEARSRAALGKLSLAVAPRARVVRDGRQVEVATRALVPGDILLLREGDIVHADAVVRSASNLSVDESQLTGESEPVEKRPAEQALQTREIPERCRVFAGSRILAGQASVEVVATGRETRFGRIGRLVAEAGFEPTPLQRRTARMVRWIVLGALGAAALVFWLRFRNGVGPGDAFLYAITLAMAAVGEEFVMVLTLFLGLGAWRLSRIGVLVRHIASVETLGSTTVICLDKTGTLTLGTYSLGSHEPLVPAVSEAELLEASALACEPNPADSMERVIVEHCAEHGVDVAGLHSKWQLIHDYDFDTVGRHMSHVWKRRDNSGWCIVAKGALEGIAEHCDFRAGERERAMEANTNLAARGMRVLAVAGRFAEGPSAFTGVRSTDERSLRLFGLLGFHDPVRPEVPAAVSECQRAGVKLKLITGDHALTAHAIADATGLAHTDDGIVTGEELDRAGPEQLASMVRAKSIFARVRPEQKYAIVDALMRAGEIVAMTGDGINDAPALSRADIGVSMGRRGTEVARAAADIVLLEDNFTALVATVREGRRIFENLQNAFSYLVGFKVMLVGLALAVPLAGLPILLTPLTLVWLELVVHPVSALLFEGRTPARDVMERPPLEPSRPILAGGSALVSAISGVLLAAAALGLYVALLGHGETYARSAAMVVAVAGSLALVWAELCGAGAWWRAGLPRDARFWVICAAVALSLPVFMLIKPIALVLRIGPIGMRHFAAAIALAFAAVAWRSPGIGAPR